MLRLQPESTCVLTELTAYARDLARQDQERVLCFRTGLLTYFSHGLDIFFIPVIIVL